MRASRPRTRSAAREHIVTIDTDSAPRIMFSGENFVVEDIKEGDELTSSWPVQVSLITGDIDSRYELRWYALSRVWQSYCLSDCLDW